MIKLNSALREVLGTHGEIKPERYNSPLFITGCMRSGTTLLVEKLALHPQLFKIGSELNDVWNKIGGAPMIPDCRFLNKNDVSPEFTFQMSSYIQEFINDRKGLKFKLVRVNEFLRKGHGRINYDWSNLIPLNKSPHLMNKIEYVGGLFPMSKFILIIRDIYAQSASLKVHFDLAYKKHGIIHFAPEDHTSCWSTMIENEKINHSLTYPKNFSIIPKMWMRLNFLALKSIFDNVGIDRVLIIKYEDIIQGDPLIWKRIFNFIGTMEKYKGEEMEIAEATLKYKNTTTKGDSLTKYLSVLTEEEIQQIRNIVDTYQEEYKFINNACK